MNHAVNLIASVWKHFWSDSSSHEQAGRFLPTRLSSHKLIYFVKKMRKDLTVQINLQNQKIGEAANTMLKHPWDAKQGQSNGLVLILRGDQLEGPIGSSTCQSVSQRHDSNRLLQVLSLGDFPASKVQLAILPRHHKDVVITENAIHRICI